MRKALELSMTTHPARAASGANSLEMLPPALNNAISMSAKEFLVSSFAAISSPRNRSFLPTERADASNVNPPTGKLRFSSVLIISMPTAPVAPTTATCGFRFILKPPNITPGRRVCQRTARARQQFSLWPLRCAPGSLGTYGFLTPPYGLSYGLELKNNPRLCTSLRVYASNTPQEAARRQSENCRAPKAKMRIAGPATVSATLREAAERDKICSSLKYRCQ